MLNNACDRFGNQQVIIYYNNAVLHAVYFTLPRFQIHLSYIAFFMLLQSDKTDFPSI